MKDVYFEDAWQKLYAEREGREFHKVTFECEEGLVEYGFMERPIEIRGKSFPYKDIVTPYAFSGPLLIPCEDHEECKKSLAKKFDAFFDEYCRENGIVAEYVQFNPWLKNHELFDQYEMDFRTHIVGIDLTRPDLMEEELDGRRRRAVRTAVKQGVKTYFDYDGKMTDEFLRLYQFTVEKYNVIDYYRFDKAFIEKIFKVMSGKAFFAYSMYEGKCAAISLNLVSEDYIHYYLAGNDPELHFTNASSLLIYDTACKGQAEGKKCFILGGAEGKLLEFKRTYTRDCYFDYYAGKRIRNPEVYDKLTAYNGVFDTKYFPAYRDNGSVQYMVWVQDDENENLKMMDKLLIMGSSSDTPYALDYCKEIGVHTIVTDYLPPEQSKGKLLADEYWMIDLKDLDALEKKCREENITGVYAGNNEFCLDQTKALAERLGLPFYASDEGWACARDKSRFKKHCMEVGLDVPKRYDIKPPFTEEKLAELEYPVIVKPADSSASRGISVCEKETELLRAYEYALEYSPKNDVIIEEFISGTEMDAHFFLKDSKVHLMLFDNNLFNRPEQTFPIPYGGINLKNYAEAVKFDEMYHDKYQKLFESMQCENGNAFIQIKKKDEKYYPFEFGYRLDGIGNWIIEEEKLGFNPLKAAVDYALGRKSSYNGESIYGKKKDRTGLIYMVSGKPGEIDKIDDQILYEIDDIHVVLKRIRPGMKLDQQKSMLQIIYYLVIVAETKEKMIEKISTINQELKVLDAAGRNHAEFFERYDELYSALTYAE